MSLPKSYQINNSSTFHVLKILNDIFGQKQAGKVWNDYLIKGLKDLGYCQSQFDMSLLWKDSCLLVIYTDDTNITGPDTKQVDEHIKRIGYKFKITTNDDIEDFFDVHITRVDDSMKFTQTLLIQMFLKDLQLNQKIENV
jgi:hypothetical protein